MGRQHSPILAEPFLPPSLIAILIGWGKRYPFNVFGSPNPEIYE